MASMKKQEMDPANIGPSSLKKSTTLLNKITIGCSLSIHGPLFHEIAITRFGSWVNSIEFALFGVMILLLRNRGIERRDSRKSGHPTADGQPTFHAIQSKAGLKHADAGSSSSLNPPGVPSTHPVSCRSSCPKGSIRPRETASVSRFRLTAGSGLRARESGMRGESSVFYGWGPLRHQCLKACVVFEDAIESLYA